jgi:hypothetical protein
MPKLNRQNIDRKTNKPELSQTEGLTPDVLLNRALQVRRDDDIVRNQQRTIYDIDYAIKWFIDNDIQPQITANEQLVPVPVIFANGEKWDNVRRLGYLRDEKGMLQSPIIMLKRNSVAERDSQRTLDVNRPQSSNQLIYKSKYNERNRYEDQFFPISTNQSNSSQQIYVVDIPKYVIVEYELLIWCDFTEQLNELVDQIMPYGRYSWGNGGNKFPTSIGSINFETVNTVGDDRLVRATIPLTVQGTLLSAQEARRSTIQKMYSVKKVSFNTVVDVTSDLFSSTTIPQSLLNARSFILNGGNVTVNNGGTTTNVNANILEYLTQLTDQIATYLDSTTITISAAAKINPTTFQTATKNEFDVYINGQYIDQFAYDWIPSDITTQTIIFDTSILGYSIEPADTIIINGRWA